MNKKLKKGLYMFGFALPIVGIPIITVACGNQTSQNTPKDTQKETDKNQNEETPKQEIPIQDENKKVVVSSNLSSSKIYDENLLNSNVIELFKLFEEKSNLENIRKVIEDISKNLEKDLDGLSILTAKELKNSSKALENLLNSVHTPKINDIKLSEIIEKVNEAAKSAEKAAKVAEKETLKSIKKAAKAAKEIAVEAEKKAENEEKKPALEKALKAKEAIKKAKEAIKKAKESADIVVADIVLAEKSLKVAREAEKAIEAAEEAANGIASSARQLKTAAVELIKIAKEAVKASKKAAEAANGIVAKIVEEIAKEAKKQKAEIEAEKLIDKAIKLIDESFDQIRQNATNLYKNLFLNQLSFDITNFSELKYNDFLSKFSKVKLVNFFNIENLKKYLQNLTNDNKLNEIALKDIFNKNINSIIETLKKEDKEIKSDLIISNNGLENSKNSLDKLIYNAMKENHPTTFEKIKDDLNKNLFQPENIKLLFNKLVFSDLFNVTKLQEKLN